MTLPELIAAWQQEAQVARQFGRSDDYPRICEQAVEALRELQQLRVQHREIICRSCYLREQLGQPAPADF
jgi:hypothetical protein